jgi:hypothetical protein
MDEDGQIACAIGFEKLNPPHSFHNDKNLHQIISRKQRNHHEIHFS